MAQRPTSKGRVAETDWCIALLTFGVRVARAADVPDPAGAATVLTVWIYARVSETADPFHELSRCHGVLSLVGVLFDSLATRPVRNGSCEPRLAGSHPLAGACPLPCLPMRAGCGRAAQLATIRGVTAPRRVERVWTTGPRPPTVVQTTGAPSLVQLPPLAGGPRAEPYRARLHALEELGAGVGPLSVASPKSGDTAWGACGRERSLEATRGRVRPLSRGEHACRSRRRSGPCECAWRGAGERGSQAQRRRPV